VRDLAQPAVLKSAALAAAGSALACFPRLWIAPRLPYPLWFSEAVLFLGGIVLWAFVFAWHTKYTGRPVFQLKQDPGWFGWVTMLGLVAAAVMHFGLDPAMRNRLPEDYPANLGEWIASLLFNLTFTQLCLVFAPFAWLVRLIRKPTTAMMLTVLIGVFVLYRKYHTSPPILSPWLLVGLLMARVGVGFLSVLFFLRGGMVLVWWWCLLLHLASLAAIR
jgi:hypothetical protein